MTHEENFCLILAACMAVFSLIGTWIGRQCFRAGYQQCDLEWEGAAAAGMVREGPSGRLYLVSEDVDLDSEMDREEEFDVFAHPN